MDAITQITLGAAVGEAALGSRVGNRAPLWGAVCGILPDLDVAVVSFMGAVEQVVYHRGFTHSILFALLVPPLLGFMLHRLYPYLEAGRREWTRLCFWAVLTHPLLDCFTTYGTQLFYPFSDYGVAFNTIFVVDPLYTTPLFIGVFAALFLKRNDLWRRRVNRIGIALSCAYLLFTVLNKLYIGHVTERSLQAQNITYSSYMTVPTFFNNVLWRAVAVSGDTLWEGDYSLLDQTDTMQFRKRPRGLAALQSLPDTWDVRMLTRFSKGYFLLLPHHDFADFIDMRFGSLSRGAGKDEAFLFTFRIRPTPEGTTAVERLRPPFSAANETLPLILNRIRGQ